VTPPPVPPASPRRAPAAETLLFWGLLALYVVPLWAFPFFPTQDGPDHQAVSSILRWYGHPGAELLGRYYRLNHEALPNWFFFFLESRALAFVAIPLAEKILLTAYVLCFPLAVRYALRGIDRQASFLAVLAFPFVYNFMFHMGFFNFCFSLPVFFLAVGFWLRRPERMGAWPTAALALLVLWTYFCHPVTLVLTVAVLLTLAGWRVLLDGKAGWWAGIRRWLAAPLVACLPALLLMASFLGTRTGARIRMLPLWTKVKHLAGLYSLASLDRGSIALAALLALLFYLLALACLRQRGRRPLGVADGLLAAVAVLTVAYFAAPSDLAGGGFINHRLNLFPFLALILWFGSFDHPPRRRRTLQVAAALLAVGFLAVFVPVYARLNRGLAEIAGAGRLIPPGHTFVFLSYVPLDEERDLELGTFRTQPYLHAGGYLAARRPLVDLSLYEANENYFPIYFQPRLNPYRHLATQPLGIELDPPAVDLPGYRSRTGGTVDYVLLWGLRDSRWLEPRVQEVLTQLDAGYELIYRSPDELALLYRARKR
jgi:hypothetical protein